MFKLHIIFVVNITFPRVTYHTIVSSTEELLTPGGEGEEVAIVCSENFLSLGIVSILLISMGFTLIQEKKRFPVQERQICY